MRPAYLFFLVVFAIGAAPIGSAQEFSYANRVAVTQPTRLDWPYPLLKRSPAEPPAALLGDYHSHAQRFEFFGPPPNAAGDHALVIFISPSDRPVGWPFFQPACTDQDLMFAGLHDAGNGKPVARRIRAVLDVLDHLRRRYRIAPERTYLAGFSGGAHIACETAFYLPEYVGGVLAIGHAPQPPQDPWLVERLRQRLSLAVICGDRDPAAPWVDDLLTPWFDAAGIRHQAVILRRSGHTMPDASVIASACAWLEAGAATRREATKEFPASSIPDAPDREEWAQRALAETRQRLSRPDFDASVLDELRGIAARWPDLPAARTAQRLLADATERQTDKTRQAAERIKARLLLVKAQGLTRLANRNTPALKRQRAQIASQAIASWREIKSSTQDRALQDEADRMLTQLTEIAKRAESQAEPLPLTKVRFNMTGQVTLREAIQHFGNAVRALGYELVVDEAALAAAGVNLDRSLDLKLPAATLDEIGRKVFRPAGLKLVHRKSQLRLIATP